MQADESLNFVWRWSYKIFSRRLDLESFEEFEFWSCRTFGEFGLLGFGEFRIPVNCGRVENLRRIVY